MKRVLIAAIGSLVLLGLLIAYLSLGQPRRVEVVKDNEAREEGKQPEKPAPEIIELQVYAAASQIAPLQQIAQQYQSEFPHRTVLLSFGASQEQLAKIETTRSGDLYIPADDSYLTQARTRQLIEEQLSIAQMRPLLVVPRGNPLGIDSLIELLSGNAKIALANPDAAAIGKRVREALAPTGLWPRLEAKAISTGNVTEAAASLKLGAVDAAIIWDGMLPAYPEFEVVPALEFDGVTAQVAVGVLSVSQQHDHALHFARYLAARDKGLRIYREAGYRAVDGPAWSE